MKLIIEINNIFLKTITKILIDSQNKKFKSNSSKNKTEQKIEIK